VLLVIECVPIFERSTIGHSLLPTSTSLPMTTPAPSLYEDLTSTLLSPENHVSLDFRQSTQPQSLSGAASPRRNHTAVAAHLSSQSQSHRSAPPLSNPLSLSHTSIESTPIRNPVIPLQERDPNTTTPNTSARRLLRKPSVGLLARLKLLDSLTKRLSSTSSHQPRHPQNIGRLPERKLRELDPLHQGPQISIDRKGNPWTKASIPPPPHQLLLPPPSVALTGLIDTRRSFEASVMADLAHDERSDISSIISASDRPVLSESDESDEILDTQKYRLPDFGKSRGSSRTGFVIDDRPTDRNRPPTPPPKDQHPPYNRQSAFNSSEDLATSDNPSYFNPYGLSRTNSIWTLSRASFSNQISQLTSITLPDASSLSSSIKAIPTSTAAAKTLNDAADQIKRWIKKATEVLDGLDAEDDVEWAAAGGREGLDEVDDAIQRFESLIDVYVGAIEDLESRTDVNKLSAQDLKSVVDRMERILAEWDSVKKSLEGVKKQVEIAMQWEELWNTVLGEIGMEEENLSRHIFEMEERRHKNSLLDSLAEPGQGLDIKELETIVEEAPARQAASRRQAANQDSEGEESTQPISSQEDSRLLSLFARMQPLRASLDFLPMRLSNFMGQARPIFPTACQELETRIEQLEAKYQKLESDAESLRKELGEDRWVLIFRKAGRQAVKMCESVERSISKLREALDDGTQYNNPAALSKRIENYEAKKEHYGPAIQQVFAIIDRGVQTRLTVNGEILRLQSDMQRRWAEIEVNIKGMNFALDQINVARNHHLRDSISTILSEQRSISSSTGTLLDTPGSSPASSVVLLSRQNSEHGTSTPFSSKSRQGSFTSNTTTRATNRYSSLPVVSGNTPGGGLRKTPVTKSSASNLRVSGASSRLYQPPPPRSASRTSNHNDAKPNRPRWNSSTSMNDTPVGHHYKGSGTPTSYRSQQPSLRGQRSFSSGLSSATSSAIPSPLGRSFHSALPSRPSSTIPPPTTQQQLSVSKNNTNTLQRPKLPASSTTSALKTPSSKPSASASAYMTPTTNTPSTPNADSTPRHLSRASITSSGSSTLTDRTIIRNNPPTPQPTPPSTAGATDQVDDSSPSSNRTTLPRPSRPSTALGSRRVSLLPQPKRVPSATTPSASQAAAQAAMSGRTTPSQAGPGASRSASRAGRMSSFGFARGKDENGNAKPRWR
jgi:archaellum component FlaC